MISTFNPQLSSLQDYILVQKNYVMALHRRIALSGINLSAKNDFERNEIDIANYETLAKIISTEKRIKQAEAEFHNMLDGYVFDWIINQTIYDETIEKAKNVQAENIDIKHLLHSVNWKQVNESIYEKINLVNQIAVALNQG